MWRTEVVDAFCSGLRGKVVQVCLQTLLYVSSVFAYYVAPLSGVLSEL